VIAVLAILLLAVSLFTRPSARPWIQLGVPLVVVASMFLPDDRSRMLACGVIVAIALAYAASVAVTLREAVVVTIAGVFLMRWLPLSDVMFWRELVVLWGVLLILWSAGIPAGGADKNVGAPLIAAAIAVATVTPIIPRRGLLFPFIIAALTLLPTTARAGVAAIMLAAVPFVRYSFAAMLIAGAITLALPLIRRIPVVPQTAAIALFALWPWSGLLARSFPAFLRAVPMSTNANGATLSASEAMSVDVPERAQAVIVTSSGAQTSRFRSGRVLGTVEVTARTGERVVREIRVGDVADFGFMRREQFFNSRNVPPPLPTDNVRGSGATSWLWGGGRVAVWAKSEIAAVRITAAADLPSGTKLQIESIDFE
jgi:hypothetical protein